MESTEIAGRNVREDLSTLGGGYQNCLLLTVIVAVGMSMVPGMPEPVSRYMITTAVDAAIEHDSLAFLG